MNTIAKLTLSAVCLTIADMLGSDQRNKQEAARQQQTQNESQEISILTERLIVAANLVLSNYKLRDAQEQEVRKAIRLINDSRSLALNKNKLIELEKAKEKILHVYNAAK